MATDSFANDMYYRAIKAEDKVCELQSVLIDVWNDYVKVGYGASHEDVEAFKAMRVKVNAALMGIGMTDANLSILLPSGSISMTIPASRQFDVLDAHSNAPGSAQTEQDRRWPGAQKIARGER